MKLEQQVASLDLARKLKELGVKQESYWFWGNFDDLGWQIYDKDTIGEYWGVYKMEELQAVVSAFGCSELSELLPNRYVSYHHSLGFWDMCEITNSNQALFGQPHFQNELRADTEADARAKMLIHLIEQKLVAP